jgi:hypothetical protein
MARLLAVPLDELATPRDGEVLTDRWWVVRDGGALFHQHYGHGWSPQCNSDRRVTEMIQAKLYPDDEIMQVPAAYVGHPDEEWGITLRWFEGEPVELAPAGS